MAQKHIRFKYRYVEATIYCFPSELSPVFDDAFHPHKTYASISRDYIAKTYTPVRIIYNVKATIVFWKDGTKTVVKLSEGDYDNPYNAFCAALAKKIFGNNSRVRKIVDKKESARKKEKCPSLSEISKGMYGLCTLNPKSDAETALARIIVLKAKHYSYEKIAEKLCLHESWVRQIWKTYKTNKEKK